MNNREKSVKIYDAITDIKEEIILSAENQSIRKKTRHRALRTAAIAAALALVTAAGVILMPFIGDKHDKPVSEPNESEPSAFAVSIAQYPKMAPYPDETKYIGADGIFDDEGWDVVYSAWADSLKAQRREKGYADGLEKFFTDSTRVFLDDGGKGENRLYSPLSLYMALSMLAETTDGNSRQQILDLLGNSDIDSLRKQASDVWNASYRDDGAVASVLANSIWMDEDISYNNDTIDSLSSNYYASSYNGKMGSEEYNKELQNWLNAQTGGLLEEKAKDVKLSVRDILAIASAVYFRSKWTTRYDEGMTQDGVFHSAAGDTQARFMRISEVADYYYDDSFAAIYKQLESGGKMWFILPDEGKSIETVTEEGRWLDMVMDDMAWSGKKRITINSMIPKFDISSGADLIEGVKTLGAEDVFEAGKADFSALSDEADGAYISKVQHDVRVAIDEEGVTAAAYTVMAMCGAGMPPEEEIDFVVDRPFMFVITNPNGLPMFTGAIKVIDD